MNILANDGLEPSAILQLEHLGHKILTTKIPQEELVDFCNSQQIDILIVRSATKVTAPILKAVKTLKFIIRAGVGIDNIDLITAQEQGIKVMNTPKSSSNAVAELVFAHLLNLARQISPMNQGLRAGEDFNQLKKLGASGFELKGKTIGIVGMGRIGQAVAKIALGFGMNVLACDASHKTISLSLKIQNHNFDVEIPCSDLKTLLQNAQIITFHIPFEQGAPALIGSQELQLLQPNAILINTARGGIIDEVALTNALNKKEIAYAVLDTFVDEPKIPTAILQSSQISITPHTGASTQEAQKAIGQELVELVDAFSKS